MASSETSRGARRRTMLPMRSVNRLPIGPINVAENVPSPPGNGVCEDGKDSGLSSECSSPTGGSPPPRQQKRGSVSSTSSIANSIARAKLDAERINGGRTSRLLRSRSGMESPRTLDSVRTRQVSSPLRPPRNIQSPSLDSGDEGSVRVERGTYQHMFQDIVSIKTMLLKLKRVLQESGENGLTRAETLNPFENSIKNGLFYNLNECDTTDASTSPGGGNITVADELADLRRQVVFLQGQLEDKDRTIQLLQLQMTKYQGINCTDAQSGASSMQSSSIKDTCNATTQTEKMRPVSAGPSLLQSLPQDGGMGPLVSWSDSWSRQRPPSLVEFDSGKGHCKPPSPPAPRPRQDETTSPSKRQNGFSERTPPERPSAAKGSPKSRDPTTTACKPATPGEVPKEYSIKVEVASKSCIPTPRKLTTPTLIPRAARAVSATGRSHNP